MTVTVKNKTPLVVPTSVRRQAGLKSGQQIEFKVAGGVIGILPKLPAADAEYTPEQRRIVDAQLAESLADVKAGRVHGPFPTHKEFIASLHREEKKLNRDKTFNDSFPAPLQSPLWPRTWSMVKPRSPTTCSKGTPPSGFCRKYSREAATA